MISKDLWPLPLSSDRVEEIVVEDVEKPEVWSSSKWVGGQDSNSNKQKRRRYGPPMTVCLHCHSHKLKCDKRRPCLHCLRKKRKCIYKDSIEEDLEAVAMTSSASSSSGAGKRRTSGSLSDSIEGQGSKDSSSDTREELRRDIVQSWNRFKAMPRQQQLQQHRSEFGDALTWYPSPSSEYISHNWFDHLLSFFGPNKANGRRMIASLLDRALQPSHYYWFDMYHRPTVRYQMSREEQRHRLHPAIAFSLMAMALRQRTADEVTSYGHGSGHVTVIPSQVFPLPRNPDDLSERLKDEAEKYLNQAMLTADKSTGSWLQSAQAATMLMQLEMELSPSYLRYLYIAAIFFRAPSLQIALDQEAKRTVGTRFQEGPLMRIPKTSTEKRSSVTMEVAARLRLLPLWVGSRIGVAFPNIEFHQSQFKMVDVQDAYSFAPWPDEEVPDGDTKEAQANSIRSRIIGLNILSTGLGARFMPYELDYSKPIPLLSKLLRALDDAELVLDLSRDVMDFDENSYHRLSMIRLITSTCHLQGVVIRRCNLAHCDALRNMVVTKLRKNDVKKDPTKGDNKEAQEEEKIPQWKINQERNRPKKFTSASISLWTEVMDTYITEMDTDHLTFITSGGLDGGSNVRLLVSRYQIDVLRLYVAATYQLRTGIINTLRLVDAPAPLEDDLVKRLAEIAQGLQDRIARHTILLEQIEQRQFGLHLTTYSNNNLPLAHPQADYQPIPDLALWSDDSSQSYSL